MEPVFDKQEALAQIGGDIDFLREVIGTFLEDCETQLSDIDSAVNRKDAATVRRAAHTIKGSAGVLAAPHVKTSASALECLGRSAEWAAIPDAVTTLKVALAELVPALQNA